MTRAATHLYRDLGATDARGAIGPNHHSQPRNWEAMLAKARGRARADGFEDGVAQAEARMDQTIAEELAALRSALNAAEEVAAEAEARANAASCDALTFFLQAIAPSLESIGAVDAMVKAVRAAFEGAPNSRFVVRASPHSSERMWRVLSEAGLRCEVEEDAALTPGQARLERSGGFDEIDLGPAVEQAIAALGGAGAYVASAD